MNTPYSDSYMKYSASEHRYVLTEQFVRERMNIDLEALTDTSVCIDISAEKTVILERISNTVYAYIYRMSPFYYAKERQLAQNAAFRLPLRRAMEEQLRYVIFNGDLSLASGVSVAEDSAIDSKRMREAEIAPLAKDILISAGIVSIAVPRFEREIEPKYEEGY